MGVWLAKLKGLGHMLETYSSLAFGQARRTWQCLSPTVSPSVSLLYPLPIQHHRWLRKRLHPINTFSLLSRLKREQMTI